MGLRVTVLGTTDAWDGDRRLDVGTPRQRAVLAALALHQGRSVPVDRLVDLVWGEAPPASVGVTLQGYVAGLRRALEPGRPARAPGQVVVLDAGGYALRVPAPSVDAWEFVVEASRVRGLDQPVEVVARADEALARWRGEPYASLGRHPAAVAERARLDELRLGMLEDRAAALLRQGHAAQVVAELQPLAAAHPFREPLWALLVRALAGAGRQAEALAALQQVRELLVAELGVEPGRELRDLQLRVLRQDQSLEPPSAREEAAPPVAPGAPAPPGPAGPPGPAAPSRLAHGRWPLVGYGDELRSLTGLVRATAADPGPVRPAVVTGEAGMGKSRLCAELAAVASGLGLRLAVGQCVDDEAPALWPWTQALRDLGLTGPPARALANPAVDPVADPVAHPVADTVADAFHAREALVAAVLAAARSAPTLLVLEDLHWADTTSLVVLQRLVSSTVDTRLVVVTTVRPGPARSPALTGLAGSLARAHAVRVDLGGLDPTGCAELSAHVSGRPVGPQEGEALAARSDGNPFFVVELARLVDGDVPAGVRDVVARRLETLPDEVAGLLVPAAVLGRDLRVDVLAEVAGLSPAATLERLEVALAAGLLDEVGVGRFRFVHALVRETVLGSTSRTRAAGLHARAALALSGTALSGTAAGDASTRTGASGDVAAVAHHWLAAGPEHAAAAWRAGRAAAAAARAVHGHAEGAELLSASVRAIDQDPAATDGQRVDLLLDLAELLRRAGRPVDVRPVVHRVLALADDEQTRLRAALIPSEGALWLASPYGEVDGVVVDALRRSLDLLPPYDDPGRCRAMLALASETYYGAHVAEREALVDEAVAMADRLGDDRLTMQACLAASVSVWRSARTPEQRALADRACRLAERLGDETALGSALTARAAATHDLGWVELMPGDLAEARAAATAAYQPVEQFVLDGTELAWQTMREASDEVARLLARMERLATSMRLDQLSDSFVSAEMMRLLWAGDHEALLGLVQAGEEASRLPLAALVIALQCRCGRVDEARQALRRRDLRLDTDDWLSPAIWSLSAEIALHVGDPSLAAAAYERLAPLAGRPAAAGGGLVLGPVDAFLAHAAMACGERAAATRHADDAEQVAGRWPAPPVLAWVRDERRRWGF